MVTILQIIKYKCETCGKEFCPITEYILMCKHSEHHEVSSVKIEISEEQNEQEAKDFIKKTYSQMNSFVSDTISEDGQTTITNNDNPIMDL